jgi:hypothetical protein
MIKHHGLAALALAVAGFGVAGCRDDGPTGIEAPNSPPASEPTGAALATMGTTPVITRSVVADGPGDQTDPHISGAIVAYISEQDHMSVIRHHNLTSGRDELVPNNGEYDFLPDVSGSRIVFSRITMEQSAIYSYDLMASGAAPVEVDPLLAANRRGPEIGGNTVAFPDFGLNASALEPEIVVNDLASGNHNSDHNRRASRQEPSPRPERGSPGLGQVPNAWIRLRHLAGGEVRRLLDFRLNHRVGGRGGFARHRWGDRHVRIPPFR